MLRNLKMLKTLKKIRILKILKILRIQRGQNIFKFCILKGLLHEIESCNQIETLKTPRMLKIRILKGKKTKSVEKAKDAKQAVAELGQTQARSCQ